MMELMPPPAPGNQLPMQNYPGQTLSERRSSLLTAFKDRLNCENPPPDEVFRDFIRDFSATGPLDFARGLLLGEGKRRILANLAICRVASAAAGRRYLDKHDALRDVDQASVELLNELTSDVRNEIFACARRGDRYQILVTLPGSELTIPLGASCFKTGQGALTKDEAERLLLTPDPDGMSMLDHFAHEMKTMHAPATDPEACAAWSALIERCISGRRETDFGCDAATKAAYGYALRGIAGRMSARVGDEELAVWKLLRLSAEAFRQAGDWKERGRGLLDMAHFEAQMGFGDLGRNANYRAGEALEEALHKLWEDSNHHDAIHCGWLGVEAYRKSGAHVLAGDLEATIQRLIDRDEGNALGNASLLLCEAVTHVRWQRYLSEHAAVLDESRWNDTFLTLSPDAPSIRRSASWPLLHVTDEHASVRIDRERRRAQMALKADSSALSSTPGGH
ncbi:hypothetical protein PAQ31011_01957 [Pandoraea aquatica]|uniref:Uncharacterized protein n=1 Tax=Pandoraea aquatica TaxID=2508290 RepID=A0A5E4UER9_9BURK|nr:hypothetical protein [Pandoraea aquatica]VVD97354.1 hypothetical protein PAQ31011_01957 [Pandoraea aquatica]